MNKADFQNAAFDSIRREWSVPGVKVTVFEPGGLQPPELQFNTGGTVHRFTVRSVPQLSLSAASEIAGSIFDQLKEQQLILTEHIQPSVATVLRQQNLNYIDAAANCHIEAPPFFLHMEGRPRVKLRKSEPIRAFKGEGLKVIFTLLLEPKLIESPFREIARLADTSLGVVQYTVHDLERVGFLVSFKPRKRRLKNIPDLFDRWALSYVENLRPKISQGVYLVNDNDRFRKWKDWLLTTGERWGGEPAAAIESTDLVPAKLTIYSRAPNVDVMKRLRILPDENGNVELMKPFWPLELERELPALFKNGIVPRVLIHADLLATRDPRNAYAASSVRLQYMIDKGLEAERRRDHWFALR